MTFLWGFTIATASTLAGLAWVSQATRHHRFEWTDRAKVDNPYLRTATEWTLRILSSTRSAIKKASHYTNQGAGILGAVIRNKTGIVHHRHDHPPAARPQPPPTHDASFASQFAKEAAPASAVIEDDDLAP